MVITKSASLGPAFGGHSKAVDEEEEEEEPGGCPWVSVTCFSVLVLIPYVAVRQAWVALIELPFQTGLSFRFFIHPPWKRSIPYHPKRGDQNEIKWIRIEHNITPQWWEGGWVGWGGGDQNLAQEVVVRTWGPNSATYEGGGGTKLNAKSCPWPDRSKACEGARIMSWACIWIWSVRGIWAHQI